MEDHSERDWAMESQTVEARVAEEERDTHDQEVCRSVNCGIRLVEKLIGVGGGREEEGGGGRREGGGGREGFHLKFDPAQNCVAGSTTTSMRRRRRRRRRSGKRQGKVASMSNLFGKT